MMKKLILGVAMLIGFAGYASAQTTTPATKKADPKKAMVAKPATTATPAGKPATTTKTVSPQGVVLKKDGTADKRYKNTTTAAGPVKKDGTPDMRYKKNKKP